MNEEYLLWFLSVSMLVCSFISGLVPMAFKLSDNKSRLLALLGSGILVGTALAIIIPEGVDSLYGQRNPSQSGQQPSATKTPGIVHDEKLHEHQAADHDLSMKGPLNQTTDPNMTWTIGVSLVVGFLLMLLIDQFSIYQSNGFHHHGGDSSLYEVYKNPQLGNYTLANQDDNLDIGMEEDDRTTNDEPASEMRPIKNSDSHKILMRTASSSSVPERSNDESIHANNNSVNPNRYYDHSRHAANHRVKPTKVTPTLGLVIHAAADGIALGAAATTSHRDVEMIIFLAIMLHKAPAAFSLVVLLLHHSLKPPTIRKHLLTFSLSAPIAAIVTYYGLSQQGKEALRRNNATGVAMLFSAGTFLFVATVHVLPELIQNKLLSFKELAFLVGGAFLPLLLAQTV